MPTRQKQIFLLMVSSIIFCSTIFAARARINGTGPFYSTISAAVANANNGDKINLSTGVFVEIVDIDVNVTIEGGFDSDCATKIDFAKTTIDGTGGGNSVIDVLSGFAANFIDLRIVHGERTGYSRGGGIEYRSNSATGYVYNCVICSNETAYGGGIYVGTSSKVAITNCFIFDNIATEHGGGIRVYQAEADIFNFKAGIYNNYAAKTGGGIAIEKSNVTIGYINIYNNVAESGGGGVYINEGASVVMNNPWIGSKKNNYIDYNINSASGTDACGGGIFIKDSTLEINDGVIAGNTADYEGGGMFITNSYVTLNGVNVGSTLIPATNIAVYGGGICARQSTLYMTNNSTLCNGEVWSGGGALVFSSSSVFENVEVENNIAYVDGGGIYFYSNWFVRVEDSYFAGNAAYGAFGGAGGGIFLIYSQSSTLIDNCTFLTNLAIYGGGLASIENQPVIQVRNSNIASNAAYYGGGICCYESPGKIDIKSNTYIKYNSAYKYGGGIYLKNSTLEIDDQSLRGVNIFDNTAEYYGGGIYAETNSMLVLKGKIQLLRNVALYGGGIYLTNMVSGEIDKVISAPIISYNYATNSGGGIMAYGPGSVVNCNALDVSFNTSGATLGGDDGGGGIAVYNGAEFNAGNVEIMDNRSENTGGGVYIKSGSSFLMNTDYSTYFTSRVERNVSANAGAGISAFMAASLRVENTHVLSNSCSSGAGPGIYCNQTASRFKNLVVAKNKTSSGSVAGIFYYNSPSAVILNSTIADNGMIGIKCNGSGTIYLTNCIVYGHSSSQLWDSANIKAVWSDIQDGWFGIGNISADPLFVDSDNFNYKISWNSPCVNAGTNLLIVANDIFGTTRPQGCCWDMGAHELVFEAIIKVTPSVLDFGEVIAGESSNLFLNVENIGTELLTGNDTNTHLPFSDNGFGGYSLAPTISTNILFTFHPLLEGDYTNEVICTGGGDASVLLIGTAVPEPCLFIIYNLLIVIYYRNRKFET